MSSEFSGSNFPPPRKTYKNSQKDYPSIFSKNLLFLLKITLVPWKGPFLHCSISNLAKGKKFAPQKGHSLPFFLLAWVEFLCLPLSFGHMTTLLTTYPYTGDNS
jgi:hypothetical protein